VSASSLRLPSRDSLPPDIEIPALPGLGTTWYEHRGARFWARRVVVSFVWALVVGCLTLITIGFLGAVHKASRGAFYVLLGFEAAYLVGMPAFVLIRTARRWNDPATGAPTFGRTRTRRPNGTRTRPRVRLQHAVGQVLLVLSPLSVGLYLAMLLTSLPPETLVERHARLGIAEELRARPRRHSPDVWNE
jgi:hypothetical protein